MASEDLMNEKPAILGAIPGSDRNPNVDFSFAPEFSFCLRGRGLVLKDSVAQRGAQVE